MTEKDVYTDKCWIPKPNSGKGVGFIAIFLAVGLLTGGVIGYFLNDVNLFSPSFRPTIDGAIENGEYDQANWRIGEYFDVNNTNGDTDGFNYFYVGQDANNVYVTVDLVSDKTNSTNSEWFSVWLNTNNRTFGGWNESWYSFRNNGTENIVYDIENEEVKPYASGVIENENLWVRNDTSYSSNVLDYGSIVGGDWSDTENANDSVIIFQTGINGNANQIKLSFSFDVADYFGMLPEYEDELLASITNAKLDIWSFLSIGFMHILDNTNVTYTKISIDNNGTYNDAPLTLDRIASPLFDHTLVDINNSAFESGRLVFSIDIYNATTDFLTQNFHYWIDQMRLTFDISQSDPLYGTSTITDDFDIAYGFGVSPNCDIPHRIYELKIHKSQLSNYTNDEVLGVYIQGSGLTFEQGDIYYFGVGEQEIWFWFFLLWDNTAPDWSVNYYQIAMNKKGE